MIVRIGAFLSRVASRAVPDPFVLALTLTAVVAAAAIVAMSGPVSYRFGAAAEAWIDGAMEPAGLAFALQMCLVLVTGHAIAKSRPVQRLVANIAGARVTNSAGGAAAIVALWSCTAALIHWGLGVVAGALLAREIGAASARAGRRVHYPLLGAAAYSGMALWHGGLSGSAPLKVAEGTNSVLGNSLQLSLGDILLSPTNLLVTGTLVVTITLLCYSLAPKDAEELEPFVEPPVQDDSALPPNSGEGFHNWLQSHWVPAVAVGCVGLAVVGASLRGERNLDINGVILLFLFSGISLTGSVTRYSSLVSEAGRGAGAIILQFPFYFGILGLLRGAGLIERFSAALVEASSSVTFPLFTFISAGAVNFAVPSGGGQWAVQGEVLLKAGEQLRVDPVTTVLAFSYGDAWTNMLQPFWALPLLAITGLRAKQIIGYTAAIFLLMAVVVPILLLVAS